MLIVGDHLNPRILEGRDAARRQGVPRRVERVEVLQVGTGSQQAGAFVGQVPLTQIQDLQMPQGPRVDESATPLVAKGGHADL